MSWIAESSLCWYHRLCMNVLKCGPVPRHVAFIMDGNRRYATKQNVQKVVGHTRGFDKLTETLLWCREMEIREVTVYAFSIENFKRSAEEVETLMQLAREKYKRLLDEKEKLHANGICIRVIGNLSLIPEDLRKSIAEAVLMTRENDKSILNVAFAYTAREEITHSIQTIARGFAEGKVNASDVTEDLVTSCLYTSKSPPPDIIIRSSGEVRFSDFLLWQIETADVVFTEVLWPEFNIWHFLACIFQFQRVYGRIQHVRQRLEGSKTSKGLVATELFRQEVEEKRLNQLIVYAE